MFFRFFFWGLIIIKYIIRNIRRSGTNEPIVEPNPPDPVACAKAGVTNILQPFDYFYLFNIKSEVRIYKFTILII